MIEIWNMVCNQPLELFILLITISIMEIFLSLDNSAVLAIMVKDLPESDRNKALKYGIIGALVFRALALFFVTYLVNIWWIKPIGGLYLLYMCFSFFKSKFNSKEEDDNPVNKEDNWLYKFSRKIFSPLVATILLIEWTDIVFSVDSILVVGSMTTNIYITCFAVFVAIISLRYIAVIFTKILNRFPYIENLAFIAIGLVSIKMLLSILGHYNENFKWIDSESTDLIFSFITLGIFFIPICISYILNLLKNND